MSGRSNSLVGTWCWVCNAKWFMCCFLTQHQHLFVFDHFKLLLEKLPGKWQNSFLIYGRHCRHRRPMLLFLRSLRRGSARGNNHMHGYKLPGGNSGTVFSWRWLRHEPRHDAQRTSPRWGKNFILALTGQETWTALENMRVRLSNRRCICHSSISKRTAD